MSVKSHRSYSHLIIFGMKVFILKILIGGDESEDASFVRKI